MNWLEKIHYHHALDPPLAEELFFGQHGKGRRRMVLEHLWGRDIRDRRVLEAMACIPRHCFLDEKFHSSAYEDRPLAIGHGQTISQPYMVAKMTELAQVREGSRVLEIGVGSGYQAAVLLELGATVFGLEIIDELAQAAAAHLAALGYGNFRILCRDGYAGLAEEAPFDAILLAAAPEAIPPALLGQLAPGGRLVAPVGPLNDQQLCLYTRTGEDVGRQVLFPVRFVPMTGQAQSAPGAAQV